MDTDSMLRLNIESHSLEFAPYNKSFEKALPYEDSHTPFTVRESHGF